jgi:hypothetical protein
MECGRLSYIIILFLYILTNMRSLELPFNNKGSKNCYQNFVNIIWVVIFIMIKVLYIFFLPIYNSYIIHFNYQLKGI